MNKATQAADDSLKDIHWLMDILQNIDVGLVVMDRHYRIHLWNSFMQNHSGKAPEDVLGERIFDIFPELSERWFNHKTQSVFVLHSATFTTWEQRPYLFRFPHYRPITGSAEFMYQNSTIIPLINSTGQVEQICLILYDVTDTAVNKLAQQQANQQLQSLSRIDHLSGLFNRGHWETCLQQELQRFERYQSCVSLILLDIDHFKAINDNHGHTVGDEVIRALGESLRRHIRDIDIAGRYGGEEFGIILPNTDAAGACHFAERLRQSIEQLSFSIQGRALNCTISLGICTLLSHPGNTTEWLARADKALYQSKTEGRNRVSVYQE